MSKRRTSRTSLTLLAESMQAASQSSKLSLLSGIPLKALMKLKQFPETWSGLTLGDLLNLEPELILESVSKSTKDLNVLTKFLGDLGRQSESPSSDSANPQPPKSAQSEEASNVLAIRGESLASGPRPKPRSEHVVMNSVEAETRIRDLVLKVQVAKNFHVLAKTRLGEFWDPERPRAPFEESLTFGQLCELKPAHLLEKRSFNAEKIISITRAVERALRAGNLASEPDRLQESGSSQSRLDKSSRQLAFVTSGLYLPAHSQSLLRLVAAECGRVSSGVSSLAKLMSQLPTSFLDREFALLWLAYDHDSDLISQMLRLDRAETTSALKACRQKLAQLMRVTTPQLVSQLELLLAGPGVKELILVQGFLDPEIDTETGQMILRLCLQALGAQVPQAFGKELGGYWSNRQGALERAMQFLISAMPKSEAELEADLGTLAPGIELNDLTPILLLRAVHNEKEQIWKLK